MVALIAGPASRTTELLNSAVVSAVYGFWELGTDFILIGHEQAARLVEQVEQGMTVEVDPYQGAGNAALVA